MLRDGNETEAMKYLGVLLHVLQDACFGVHALEGPGGCDLFFFDRLGISDFSPAAKLAQLDAWTFRMPPEKPVTRQLGSGGGSPALFPILPDSSGGPEKLCGNSDFLPEWRKHRTGKKGRHVQERRPALCRCHGNRSASGAVQAPCTGTVSSDRAGTL